MQRLAGTLLGVGLSTLFHVWTPEGLPLVATVGVLVFGFVALLRRNLMLALMLVTPMALLLVVGGRREDLGTFTGIRIIDTVVGVLVAACVLSAVIVRRRLGSRATSARS